jgi:hypothetical protein
MISRRSRTLQSPKYLQKKRRKSIAIGALYFICVGAILLVAILLLRLPYIQIASVEPKEFEETVLSVMNGSYAYIIPKSNSFFYPKDEIVAAVASAHKEADNIRVSRKNFSTIEIIVAERAPAAIVCEGFREEDEIDECFFADTEGYVYGTSPGFSDGVYPRYYVSLGSATVSPGTYFLDSAVFKDLQRSIASVKDSGVVTLGTLISGDGSYELYIKNPDQSTAVVYFDSRTPFEDTMSNLVTFLENKKESFNYINLRFGNNVFYSLK